MRKGQLPESLHYGNIVPTHPGRPINGSNLENMNIICLGPTNWDWCWTGRHHMLKRLAARGHRVLYIDPKWDFGRADLKSRAAAFVPVRSQLGLREIDYRLFVYTYPFARGLPWRLNKARLPGVIQRLVRRLAFNDPVLMTLLPETAPYAQALSPLARIYYAVDDMSEFGGTDPQEKVRIRRMEESLLRGSDLALAVSPRLVDKLKHIQPRTFLLPSGADTDHYATGRINRSAPHPLLSGVEQGCIGLFGYIDDRIDQELVKKIAGAHPRRTLALIGRMKKGVDFSTLRSCPNVRFLGYQPYEELPRLLKHIDVCIVPYKINELTRACSPIKVYEYLASGRPVVSTPLEGLYFCKDVIETATSHEEFLAKIDSALHNDSPENRKARLAVAAQNGWDSRTDLLEKYIGRAAALSRDKTAEGAAAFYRPRDIIPFSTRLVHDDASRPSPRLTAFISALNIAGRFYYVLRLAGRLVTGRRPFKIRKILITRTSRLGDMVVFMPALKTLRRLYPRARIVMAIRSTKSVEDLLCGLTMIDEIRQMSFMNEPAARKLKKGLGLFFEGFDLVITGTSYFIKEEAFFTGAPYRMGMIDGHPLQRFNNRARLLDITRHEADNNKWLIASLKPSLDKEQTFPRLPEGIDARIAKKKTALLKDLPLHPEHLILMHPGAQKQSRRWPEEYFAVLAQKLLESRPQASVVFSGIQSEKGLAESIRERLAPSLRSRTVNLCGKLDILSLAALMEHGRLFISNDTGVMHLARERGCPLLALLGPENDYRWSPYPLGKGPAVSLRHEVPCAPCLRKDCPAHYCMRTLGTDEAFRAAGDLLGIPRDSASPSALDRRLVRHSWDDLDRRGFPLPLVTVAVIGDKRSAGRKGADTKSLEALTEAALGQTYPRLEIVVCSKRFSFSCPIGECALRFTGRHPKNEIGMWQMIVEHSSGEYIALMRPDSDWPVQKIADDVRTLFRNPDIHYASSMPLKNSSPRYTAPRTVVPGRTTIRRSHLQTRLRLSLEQSRQGTARMDWGTCPVFLGHNIFAK